MNVRILYNVLLVRLGLRSVLPGECIRRVRVADCHEPLVSLPGSDAIVTAAAGQLLARSGMAERLFAAAGEVGRAGYRLMIFETYRSPAEQVEHRAALDARLRRQHPGSDEREIQRRLAVGVAGVGGGHQTGGAVDLTLCDARGDEIDMGTRYREHGALTPTRCAGLTPDQSRHRDLLLRAMRRAGFVNYPAEWWHYCYGDAMWAAYSFRRTAIYGPVEASAGAAP